ncbi:MAG: DNA primase [Candidatus Paceibacterota bacterium]
MLNSPVQKIKERLSVEEVISSYIKIEKVGSSLKAKCPFHNEKTPSFFISNDRGNYYCFGCGAKGDIFTFVEEFEGLDFKGALKLLAERAGVQLENYNSENESEKEKLYRIMEEATKFFEKNLVANVPVLKYLKDRGLEDKTIKDFRIGFIKADWRELYNFLQKNGFKDLEMEKAGLVKKTEKGYYDRFRGRIMFPISDSSGRIIAFSGRIFEDDGKSAKYLNSPETSIFTKSSVLYGLDKAKDSIRKNNFSILVEGQFDLILSHQAGYKNTVATSGTALSDSTISKENVVSNLGLIRRLSKNLVLAFDADKAGFNAVNRASKIALSFGMDVKVALMPDNIDPADLISKNGADAWKIAVKNSKHIIEFLLDKVLKDFASDTRKSGREIKEKVLPYVDMLESSIEKAHFLKKISDLSQIPEVALKEDLLKIEKEFKYEKEEIEKAKDSENKIFKKDYIERRLLGIILWQKNITKQSVDISKVSNELVNILKTTEEELLDKAKDNKEDLIFEAEVFYGGDVKLEKDVLELLHNLKEEYLNEELSTLMMKLQKLNGEEEIEILKRINEINKEKEKIKNSR